MSRRFDRRAVDTSRRRPTADHDPRRRQKTRVTISSRLAAARCHQHCSRTLPSVLWVLQERRSSSLVVARRRRSAPLVASRRSASSGRPRNSITVDSGVHTFQIVAFFDFVVVADDEQSPDCRAYAAMFRSWLCVDDKLHERPPPQHSSSHIHRHSPSKLHCPRIAAVVAHRESASSTRGRQFRRSSSLSSQQQ